MSERQQILKEVAGLLTTDLHMEAKKLEMQLQSTPDHDPDDLFRFGKVQALLGENIAESGNIDQASATLSQVLSRYPNIPHVPQVLATLELRGPYYLEALGTIQKSIAPRTYVEIGIWKGNSLKLVAPNTKTVGIDPKPLYDTTSLPCGHKVVSSTSDEYFAGRQIGDDLNGLPVELSFIDGMHLFEYALRDFINLEKHAAPEGLILVHDCYPLTAFTAQRKRQSGFWSGDVWKLVVCLKKYRPDLIVEVLPCPPTGLAAISRLNPSSVILGTTYETIVEEFIDMDFAAIENRKVEKLNLLEPAELKDKWYFRRAVQ